MTKKKILIVGGVAGGASAAARARRLCESCDIILFDKGEFISFANCGLPYVVGNVIQKEEKLIVASPQLFKERFNIEARTQQEVLSIDKENKEIEVKNLVTGKVYRESYTHLILSPGAKPISPPLPGIDLPGIFSLRTIPDSRKIIQWIQEHKAKSAAVIGAGFIGLEMTENLVKQGLKVSLIDLANQVMPPVDPEMSMPIEKVLQDHGVDILLKEKVQQFKQLENGSLSLQFASGKNITVDMVILSMGIQPQTELAEQAGLKLGSRGGIQVNSQMQTNDSSIWAVGDAIEVEDFVTHSNTLVPLAGPANRQGRIAADNIFGKSTAYRGTQGTAVCEVFGVTIAMTGIPEKQIKRSAQFEYESIYLHPGHHVGYYPGAKPIHIKLIFEKDTGKILGAQATGEAGVARRIDVISTAMQFNGDVMDLEETELCYAPQFGAAKDPVNLAGMIASNVIRGDVLLASEEDLNDSEVQVIDVREPHEFEAGSIPHSINIPLGTIRDNLEMFQNYKSVVLYCGVGQRAYYANRLLKQVGVQVKNLSGGYTTWKMKRKLGCV